MSETSLMRKSKKRSPVIKWLIILAMVVFVTFGVMKYADNQYAPIDPGDSRQIDIYIPQQSSARQIAATLQEKGLIRSEQLFLIYIRHNHLDNRLLAGHYRFSRSLSLQEIADIIAKGKVVRKSFTIPEGFTVKQIGNLLVKQGICKSGDWSKAINQEYDYNFLKDVSSYSLTPLEGFLFPDTYSILESTTAEQIIQQMLNNFQQHWNGEVSSLARKQGLSVRETVIIASIIEKEANQANERRRISGVIHNRLQQGMLLQLCPTVLYCLGQEDKENVSYEDLQVDSLYNTYKYAGLPPGPISCPGAASILAALNPEKHNYYYYVAKGDGSHYFSKTYSEHLAAQKRYSK